MSSGLSKTQRRNSPFGVRNSRIANATVPPPTGSASCTKAEITKAVSDLSSSDYADAKLATGGGPSYKCADGWAVGFVDVGMGMEQYTTTVVWQAEGQFWVPQDRGKVCPKPSQVPAAIYDLACNSN